MARRRSNPNAFADAFSSSFNAVKGLAQAYKSGSIMDEEVIESEDEEGNKSWGYGGKTYDHKVEGDELRGLQYDRIGAEYLRWGDTGKALEQRGLRADLRTKKLDSDLKEQTLDSNVALKAGEVIKQESQTQGIKVDTLKTLQGMKREAELHPFNVTSAQLTNEAQKLTNSGKELNNEEKEVLLETTKMQHEIKQRNTQALIDMNKMIDEGVFKNPGEIKSHLKNNIDMTGNPEMIAMLANMGDSAIKSKMNEAKSFRLDLNEHLRNDNPKDFLDYFDSVDGIIGNQELVQDENGFRIVPIGENGAADLKNPIVQGKTWEEFKVNVDAWADPSNTLEFLTQKETLANKKEDTKRLTALTKKYEMEAVTPQSLAAYRKAKMAYLGDLVTWDEAVEEDNDAVMKNILKDFDAIYAGGLGYKTPVSNKGLNGKPRSGYGNPKKVRAVNPKGETIELNPDTNEWEPVK